MDYSRTYFITSLVFTHDKLAEALKQLVQFPWHGVYPTPASLIRATNDVILDISLLHTPAACETRIFLISHTLSLLVDIETFRRKSVLFRTGCWVCSLGRFQLGGPTGYHYFPRGLLRNSPRSIGTARLFRLSGTEDCTAYSHICTSIKICKSWKIVSF